MLHIVSRDYINSVRVFNQALASRGERCSTSKIFSITLKTQRGLNIMTALVVTRSLNEDFSNLRLCCSFNALFSLLK
jgi:hypothetical protein